MATNPKKSKTLELKAKKESSFNIAINLKDLMRRANISEHELSRRTHVRQPIIHRLLSGENTNPKLETLKPISEYFMITVSQLIGEKISEKWSGLTSGKHYGLSEIPLVDWEQVLTHRSNDTISKSVVTDCKISKAAFAIKIINSDSEPLFPNGSVIIIEPQLTPEDNDYVIIKSGEKAVLRQILFISKKMYVVSINKYSRETNKVLSKNDIIGVVLRTIYDHKSFTKP